MESMTSHFSTVCQSTLLVRRYEEPDLQNGVEGEKAREISPIRLACIEDMSGCDQLCL